MPKEVFCVKPFRPTVIQYGSERPAPTLQRGEWSPILQWQGITLHTLTFVVRVKSADQDASVAWRRWGGAIVPYSYGVFQKSMLLHVYPGDLFFRVDVKPLDPNVELVIEPLS